MEVKSGRKQTEVGIIPEDWGVDEIRNLAQITTGARNTQDNIRDGDYPFFVRSPIVERINTYSYDGEAVLTAGDGVGTGKIFHYINGKFDFHQRVYKISDFKKDTLQGYFFYLYFSNYFYDRIMSMTAKSSVDSVRMEVIAGMKIPLPPLSQQRRIAATLRDVDTLLAALDELIYKKRLIKQGAKQELLMGKKRIPGFRGEWEVKKLSELCTAIMDGTHFTPTYVSEGVPFYSVENVTANDFINTKFISPIEHNRLIKRCKPEKGDILMTRIGSLGNTKLIDWNVNASIYVSLALLKVNEQAINGEYLFCYTKSKKFVKDVEFRSLINAIPQKINMRDIGDVPILVPSLHEQTAIAEILNDMDAEIAALKARREKTRLLKQGMMQELLTGRIRLV
jgi:type I restriction enzyme, S subunit